MGAPTRYQRVNTATDYDTVGFLPYLFCDGIDDGMSTANIDFTGTDKVTVVAGLRKLSDAATGMLLELSPDRSANVGSFDMRAPESSLLRLSILSRGTAGVSGNQQVNTSSDSYLSPRSLTVAAIYNISASSNTLRVNGVHIGASSGPLGTGNYGNYPLYLFRRGGTTFPFNGRFKGLVIIGTLLPEGQLQQLERWMNRKTGAF
jgi:hypothetical protein